MQIRIIKARISAAELTQIARDNYGDMAKGVIDMSKKTIALGGELHADAEAVLLKNGSLQEDLWGFNIFIAKPHDERLEYTSFINIRPRQGNRSLEIQDAKLRTQMKTIIDNLVE